MAGASAPNATTVPSSEPTTITPSEAAGDAVTGRTNSFDGVTVVNGSGFTIKDITSNDLKLGVRWNFDVPQPVAPLIRKG